MKITSVSKLKAFLSGYLRRVKTGEEVLVIERGRPIAKIAPATGSHTRRVQWSKQFYEKERKAGEVLGHLSDYFSMRQ